MTTTAHPHHAHSIGGLVKAELFPMHADGGVGVAVSYDHRQARMRLAQNA